MSSGKLPLYKPEQNPHINSKNSKQHSKYIQLQDYNIQVRPKDMQQSVITHSHQTLLR